MAKSKRNLWSLLQEMNIKDIEIEIERELMNVVLVKCVEYKGITSDCNTTINIHKLKNRELYSIC